MMTGEEIRFDLMKYVKRFYEPVDILHLDLVNEEVELRFHVMEEDRSQILSFYESNQEIFQEKTDQAQKDLETLKDISIRVDQDGIYFGKSSYDFLATNVVAFFLLEKYLNQPIEELHKKLLEYKRHYMVQ